MSLNMRRGRLWLLPLVVAGGLIAIEAFGSTGPVNAHAAATEGPSSAVVTSLALANAQESEDATPTLVQHVATTRGEAMSVMSAAATAGEKLPSASATGAVPGAAAMESAAQAQAASMSGDPVTLIAEAGRFTMTDASVPQGFKEPTGRVMILMYDDDSGQVLGAEIGNTYPDLAAAGTVVTDSSSVAESAALRRHLRVRA